MRHKAGARECTIVIISIYFSQIPLANAFDSVYKSAHLVNAIYILDRDISTLDYFPMIFNGYYFKSCC
jgi:hypothetical protein